MKKQRGSRRRKIRELKAENTRLSRQLWIAQCDLRALREGLKHFRAAKRWDAGREEAPEHMEYIIGELAQMIAEIIVKEQALKINCEYGSRMANEKIYTADIYIMTERR